MKYWITWTSTPESLDMGGAPPNTDTLIRPATCGRCPNQTCFKTTRQRALSLSCAPALSLPVRVLALPSTLPCKDDLKASLLDSGLDPD